MMRKERASDKGAAEESGVCLVLGQPESRGQWGSGARCLGNAREEGGENLKRNNMVDKLVESLRNYLLVLQYDPQ